MQGENYTLITTIGWEDRFLSGTNEIFKQYNIKAALAFYYTECTDFLQDNMDSFIRKTNELKVNIQELKFNDAASSYKLIMSSIQDTDISNILIDISTMPRELIWILLDLLTRQGCTKIKYCYSHPLEHATKLLNDPSNPRIVIGLGGVSLLGAPLKLLIVTGFGIERINKLLSFYEPEQVALINDAVNKSEIETKFSSEDTLHFTIDYSSDDKGDSIIDEAIMKMNPDKSNILLCSHGPKLSAISLFHAHKKYSSTSLVYTPAIYNRDYSTGYKNTIFFDYQHPSCV